MCNIISLENMPTLTEQAVAQAGAEEAVEFADIDLGYIEQVRSQIPCRNQKRKDLYESAKSM